MNKYLVVVTQTSLFTLEAVDSSEAEKIVELMKEDDGLDTMRQDPIETISVTPYYMDSVPIEWLKEYRKEITCRGN